MCVTQGMAVVPLQLPSAQRAPACGQEGSEGPAGGQTAPASAGEQLEPAAHEPGPQPSPRLADAVLLRIGPTGDLYVGACCLLPAVNPTNPSTGLEAEAASASAGAACSGHEGSGGGARVRAAAAEDVHGRAREQFTPALPQGRMGSLLGGGLDGPGRVYDICPHASGPAQAGEEPEAQVPAQREGRAGASQAGGTREPGGGAGGSAAGRAIGRVSPSGKADKLLGYCCLADYQVCASGMVVRYALSRLRQCHTPVTCVAPHLVLLPYLTLTSSMQARGPLGGRSKGLAKRRRRAALTPEDFFADVSAHRRSAAAAVRAWLQFVSPGAPLQSPYYARGGR